MCQNIDAMSNHDLWFLINICQRLYYIHTVSDKNICIVLFICKRVQSDCILLCLVIRILLSISD